MSAFQPTNIIFDFGGVIIDTSIDIIIDNLLALGLADPSVINSAAFTALVKEFESGLIAAEPFRVQACALLGLDIAPAEFERIWNSMLIGIPAANIDIVRKARRHYGIYLLSNTNETHFKCFGTMFAQAAGEGFDTFFDRAYFSHMMGMAKPDKEIFESVLRAEGLRAGDTLFVDDNINNIRAATDLGIACCWLAHGLTLSDVFDNDGMFVGTIYHA